MPRVLKSDIDAKKKCSPSFAAMFLSFRDPARDDAESYWISNEALEHIGKRLNPIAPTIPAKIIAPTASHSTGTNGCGCNRKATSTPR